MIRSIVAANESGRQDLATKTGLAQSEDRLEAAFARLEAKLDAMVNRMVLNQVAVSGLLFAALKLC